jgi:aryl-alcohol dehydrogenase-like predicted oxidoreductase
MRVIAKSRGASIATVAPAGLFHQPQVTSVILGAKRPEQLPENIKSAESRRKVSASSNRSGNAASRR